MYGKMKKKDSNLSTSLEKDMHSGVPKMTTNLLKLKLNFSTTIALGMVDRGLNLECRSVLHVKLESKDE